MIVLGLQVDPSGTEILSAWTSEDGIGLAQSISVQSVGTFSSAASLARFIVQQKDGSGDQTTRGRGNEMRFGTNHHAVTSESRARQCPAEKTQGNCVK